MIEFTPSEDYDILKKQFISLMTLFNAKRAEAKFWQGEAEACDESVIEKLREELESEREMNHQLTNELMVYESRRI